MLTAWGAAVACCDNH